MFCDKEHTRSQPLPSCHCAASPYCDLTKRSLIWKRFGGRLPDSRERDEEEQTRDGVGRHPCDYISSPRSVARCPYSYSILIQGIVRHGPNAYSWMQEYREKRCRLPSLGFALFLLSRWGEGGSVALWWWEQEPSRVVWWSDQEQRPDTALFISTAFFCFHNIIFYNKIIIIIIIIIIIYNYIILLSVLYYCMYVV